MVTFNAGFAPGMICQLSSLLDENPNPTDDEIKRGIEGNFVGTGYSKILKSIKAVAPKEEE